MKKKSLIIAIAILILSTGRIGLLLAQELAIPVMKLPDNLLSTLKAVHPRLHASAADFAALKQRIASDATLKTWYDGLVQQGDKILGEEPSIYIIPDGLRLLSTSRRVVGRTYTLG